MLTKEQIIQNVADSPVFYSDDMGSFNYAIAEAAMDQYSTQQSIAFAQWMEKNTHKRYDNGYIIIPNLDKRSGAWFNKDEPEYTIEQLYTIFTPNQSTQ